jgi:hypothetical protein
MPQHIKDILKDHKYLRVPTNAQVESGKGKQKILSKMQQRIAIISKNTNCIQEARILHNMLVCQVATFSPICIKMNLKECFLIDKRLISLYQYRLNYMASDAKHNIFLSHKKGGIGIHGFTHEYIGALLQDIEVYISNRNSLTSHARIEEVTKQCIWILYNDGKIPCSLNAAARANHINISGKHTLYFIMIRNTHMKKQYLLIIHIRWRQPLDQRVFLDSS